MLGEGRVAGEVPERRLGGEPLRRLPAAGRRPLDGRPGHGAGDPPHHLGGEHRPVAPEGLDGARVVDRLEGHGPPGPLGAEGGHVDGEVVLVRVGEEGLRGGDDPRHPEARQVGGTRHLHVLDPVTAAARAVRAGGALEGGEGHVDPPVADRVEHDLPAGLVVGGHGAIELLLRPVREAGAAPRVGLEHRRRLRLHHAVHVTLHRAHAETALGEAAAQLLLPGEGLGRWVAFDVERHVDAEAGDGLEGASEELQLLPVDPGLVHAREAPRRGLGDTVLERALLLVGQELRHQLPHEVHRVLLQRTGGLALLVAHDLSARRILRLAGDAGKAQCHRVGPAGVAVVGDEPGGAVRHDGVELCARGKAAREGGVGPPPAGHPVDVGVGGRPVPDAYGERAEAEGVVEPQLLEGQAPAQEV